MRDPILLVLFMNLKIQHSYLHNLIGLYRLSYLLIQEDKILLTFFWYQHYLAQLPCFLLNLISVCLFNDSYITLKAPH